MDFLRLVSEFVGVFVGLVAFAILVVTLVRLARVDRDIALRSERIVELFQDKTNKIPAMLENIRRYSNAPGLMEMALPVYERAVMLDPRDVYAVLEPNERLGESIAFLFRFAARIPDLQRDSSFIATRNYVVYAEQAVTKEIRAVNALIARHRRLRALKNWTILGLLVPVGEYVEIG